MTGTGAYGRQFAERFHIDTAPTIVSRSLQKAEIGVTEIRCDGIVNNVNQSIPREDAYLIALQLRDFPDHQYWEDGQDMPVSNLKAGQSLLYDLKRDPVVLLDKPFHSVHFYLSRATLNAVAEDANARPVSELDYQPGAGTDDAVIASLTHSMLAGFSRPDEISQLFLDHVTLAITMHVVQAYGGLRPGSRQRQGGLAPWQQKRAQDIMAAALDGSVPLRVVAQECGLSVSHFSRAFRQSVGMAPHRWLIRRRIELARNLLNDRRLALPEIAIACGFADQSHFTRVFKAEMGISPGAWRRNLEPSFSGDTQDA